MVSVTDVEIIIARYNESLSWTLLAPFNQFKYTVYNKGDNAWFEKKHVSKIINLPNVGRNDHTYLYHIAKNYDNLSLITVFFPGSIDLKYKMRRAKKILLNLMQPNNDKGVFIGYACSNGIFEKFKHFKLDEYTCSAKMNKIKNGESKLKLCTARPYGNWYRTFFGKEETPFYTYWGIFAIHRNDIVQHNVSRYDTLLSILSTHSNPEAGHYIERSWGKIFHPMNFTNFHEEPEIFEPIQNKMKMTLLPFQHSPHLPRHPKKNMDASRKQLKPIINPL